ncbi:MAG: PilN domain-containing protein [Phycisphaerae bacterium]
MLRVLNFLPDDYVKRRRARRANLICALIGAGGLLFIGAAVGLTAIRAVGVAAARTAVDRQYEQARLKIKDLKELEERKKGLLHKAELSATLLERVPRSHILGRLTNLLPPDTSLTSLSMEPHEMRIETPQPKAEEAKAKKGKGKKKAAPPAQTETRFRFRLDGLAQTDVQVAEYISRLANDALFDSVDLQFSEAFPYEEGITMRRFQLVFLLDRKAATVLEKAPLPPGAPADTAAATQAVGRGKPAANEEAS